MTRTKKNYKPGDVFTVPLRLGGFATGVVARVGYGSITFGYFFGPQGESFPTKQEVDNLASEKAILAKCFGALGLVRGEWSIVGTVTPWNASEWPLPAFVRVGSVATGIEGVETARIAFCNEDELTHIVREQLIPISQASEFFDDGLAGYGAIEISLTRMLSTRTD